MRAAQDSQYAASVNEYQRKVRENQERNDTLKRRYDELIRDENYKVDQCRLCPSCRRVVERLEGCDTMICGQDAHGGNVQSGCGNKFNWSNAVAYQPSTQFQPQQTRLELPKPEQHIAHHHGVKFVVEKQPTMIGSRSCLSLSLSLAVVSDVINVRTN
jgi:hypothetical protein